MNRSGLHRVPLAQRAVAACGHRLRLLVADMASAPALVAAVVMLGFALLGGASINADLAAQDWLNPANNALVSTLYLAPLVTGAAVWSHQDLRRRHVHELAATTPRGRDSAALLRAVSVLVWALLAYTIFGLVMLLRYPPVVSLRVGAVLLVLLAVLTLVAFALLGTALAAASSARVLAALAAAGVLGWLYVLNYTDGVWWQHLAPSATVTIFPSFLQPRALVVVSQLAALVGLSALCLAIISSPQPRRRLLSTRRITTAVTGLIILLAGVGGLARLGAASTELRGPPDQPVCQDGTVRLCLRPVNAKKLNPAAQTINQAATRLHDYWPIPEQLSEAGMQPHPNRRRGLGVYDPPDRPAQLLYREAALSALIPESPCPMPQQETSSPSAFNDLKVWAEHTAWDSGTTPVRQQRIRRILHAPPPQQHQWVADRLQQLHSCHD